jgi:hypothetical protein
MPGAGGQPTTNVSGRLGVVQEVVPILRKELESRRAPGVPDAPTHASLIVAKYGDAVPRQPRPNPNRGDNLSGTSPYQDSDPTVRARFPVAF